MDDITKYMSQEFSHGMNRTQLLCHGLDLIAKFPVGVSQVLAELQSRDAIIAEQQRTIDALKAKVSSKEWVLLPRNPTRMMTLRGLQGDKVFTDSKFDLAQDYFEFCDLPTKYENVKDRSDIMCHDDDREYYVIKSIYQGCIEGFEEQQRRNANPDRSERDKQVDAHWSEHWPTPVERNEGTE
ncbi:hypothetical protein [Achromobacter phage Motura]|uniref:Uncharacterized protein n=1 Tax=Achromobacter phage Motura TaxID=2591403 RepID=A0A514CT80_9CAUD|nr:hypothetical protein H1O15_gp100 [Achromobacter phage Motura]QDH83650.1 hypothetical protein [Achromobacter phage Motura]